jgi:hypothetical protein
MSQPTKVIEYRGIKFYCTQGRKIYRPSTENRRRGFRNLHEQIWVDAGNEIPKHHRVVHVNGDTDDNHIENLAIEKIARYFKPGGRVYRRIGESVVYNGITFYRYPESKYIAHRQYFAPGIADRQRGVDLLHRQIWKDACGQIPDGYHIHHKDRNTGNNSLDNLELVSLEDHQQEHYAEQSERGKSALSIEHLEQIRPMASAWHASDEGIAWHREHGKKTWDNRQFRVIVCAECGGNFETRHGGEAIYCSERCYQKHLRKAGKHKNHLKTCEHCGKEFMGIKRSRYCSRSCSVRHRLAEKKASVQSES